MKPVEDRLEASLRYGVIDGSAHEKAVFACQVQEAINELRMLRNVSVKPASFSHMAGEDE